MQSAPRDGHGAGAHRLPSAVERHDFPRREHANSGVHADLDGGQAGVDERGLSPDPGERIAGSAGWLVQHEHALGGSWLGWKQRRRAKR